VAKKKKPLRLHQHLLPHQPQPLNPRLQHLLPTQHLQHPLHLLKKRKKRRSNSPFSIRKTGASSAGFFMSRSF